MTAPSSSMHRAQLDPISRSWGGWGITGSTREGLVSVDPQRGSTLSRETSAGAGPVTERRWDGRYAPCQSTPGGGGKVAPSWQGRQAARRDQPREQEGQHQQQDHLASAPLAPGVVASEQLPHGCLVPWRELVPPIGGVAAAERRGRVQRSGGGAAERRSCCGGGPTRGGRGGGR
jgi:hypothetical protein